MKYKELNQPGVPNEARSIYKVGNLIINVKSHFHSEKSLDDILFSIASMKLKEKSA